MSEKNESRTQAIWGYVDGKIQWLWGLPENQRRAELAKLRRGIGHAPGELPELWGGLLQGMPASFYGTNGPSHEAWAVYLALTLYALRERLRQELGREPSLSELSDQTGWTPEEIAQVDLATEAPDSLQRETADGLALEGLLGTEAPEEGLVERIALREAVDQLPEKERMTILLRYFKGLTQERAARVLGVSQVQVSRLERRGLERLRQSFAE